MSREYGPLLFLETSTPIRIRRNQCAGKHGMNRHGFHRLLVAVMQQLDRKGILDFVRSRYPFLCEAG
jgi:hypothetical protein